MKRIIFPIVALCYIAGFFITSAGAVNYAFANGEHIYTVAAIINAAFGIYATVKMYKWSVNNDNHKA